MKLSFGDAGLNALDGLTGLDCACVFVAEDERPLRGLGGWLDWRLCGGLSRILEGARFSGAFGDSLLFPCSGSLGFGRVFCFGIGRRDLLAAAAFGRIATTACQALARAGMRRCVAALPPVVGADEAERARLFLHEGAVHFKGERIVLLGDGRALARAFNQAGRLMAGLEIDAEPLHFAPPAPTASAAPPRAKTG